ncbi:retrovirus-related pol polyprotein from transposon TNT 1-94 [Tanacetum coccineum]
MNVSPIPTTRIHKDHPKDQIIVENKEMAMQDELLEFSMQRFIDSLIYPKARHAMEHNEVEKALYGLHQAPRAWSTKKSLCVEFEQMMHKRFQMSSMRELTFFLGLQDEEAEDVDVHLYRSIIESLMYLTASRPDIMFDVCACARFQVTPKVPHLHAVKGIFRYLKVLTGNPQQKVVNFLAKIDFMAGKKQNTIVANSKTEVEYVAATNCCGQSSGPIHLVADETVIKEWEDRMERVATTASSLEAERDSGNINRTQSMATLMSFFPHRLNLLLPVLVYAARHTLTAVRHKLMLPGITYYCRTSAKVKTVNGERQIQALVDKKDVIISETSIRNDLQLDDADWKHITTPEEHVSTPSYDSPPSGEDRMQLAELMSLCTNLHEKVLDLEKAKTAQAKEITSLKKRVKQLEKRNGRKIKDLDADAKVTLVDETQEMNDDNLMFDTGVLEEQEIEFEKVVEEPVVSELTLVSNLIRSNGQNPSSHVTTAATTVTSVRPRAKGIIFHDQEEQVPASTKTFSSSQSQLSKGIDKGKGKMVEPEVPLKKKDQVALDEEMARNLEAQLQAELIEEERLVRQKEEEANIALIQLWDNTQAMMEADFELAQRLQAEKITDPNGDALKKCILEGPYTPSTVVIPTVPATDNSPAVPEQTTVETILNIYKVIVDSILVMFNFFNNFNQNGQAKNANPLALVATAQPYQDPYYQAPKSHKSYAPTSKASIPTRSHATTRHKGKETAKPITPPSESVLKEDSDPEQAQKDKEMQKNLALIAKYFKKLYKPTNNNLRTSSNTRNKNVDTTLRYKNDNQTGQFRNQRTMTVAGARETIGSPVVKQSGIQCFNCKEFGHFAKECIKQKKVKDSTLDEEIDEQELEAQYSYMAKIQEVPTADSGIDSEPLEQVQYDTGYNVFANEIQHSEQSESIINTCVVETGDSNVIPASPDMCDNDIQNDQNDVECDDERVAHVILIANLKLDVDENKKIQKQLKKANTTLAHELTECKSILA